MNRAGIDAEVAKLAMNKADTIAFLTTTQCRLTVLPFSADMLCAQVLHDGVWKDLCRTDLLDNITTWKHGHEHKEAKTIVVAYIGMVLFGARINDDTFAVVDARTDG